MLRSLLFATTLFIPTTASAVLLKLPLACTPGQDCFVQNYVDHDVSSGAKEFRCGHLTYDGHKGTDIRLPSLTAMETGVNVLAAASGTVKGVRDGVEDVNIKDIDPSTINGRECGNGVTLEHKEGWETQYCHMKKGSVTVAVGDKVKTGDVLGQVGLSGHTEFPHLHFELRQNGEVIDPFTGKEMNIECGQSGFSKWHPDLKETIGYNPPGLIAAGFTTEQPDSRSVMEGKHRAETIAADAPLLIFWAQVYGPRIGDVLKMKITKAGEHGDEVIAEHEVTMEKSMADYMKYIGKKVPKGGFTAGEYVGHFSLTRTTDEGLLELVKKESKISVE